MNSRKWTAIAVIAAIAAATPASASTMSVETFLKKANSLKKRGPLALFSGDIKLLMNQVKGDAGALRSERLAAKAAGRPQAFCPPEAGAKLTDKDILGAMEAVPGPRRASTDTKSALRSYMARRFPCRA